MQDICVLNDLEKVKAISDPLRIQILQHLIKQRFTAKQIADLVQQSSSKVHYHVKELEKQGLITLVSTVEKGGILEKYYRAVAKNYYIDQTLGEFFEKNEASSLGAVTQDILSWRRHNRLKVDVDTVAKKIIHTCLRVAKNEVVCIIGGTHQMDLIEPLAMEIQKAGAFPLLSIQSTKLKYKTIEEADPEIIAENFAHISRLYQPVTTMIMLEHVIDPFIARNIPSNKADNYRIAWSKVRNELMERKVKWAFIGYPTQAQAEAMNIDFLEFYDVFWKSIDINYQILKEKGQNLAKYLAQGEIVSIKSNQGTDIKFSIKGRKPFIDDGIITEDDLINGENFVNLPSGEVYIAPVENSADGIACFDLAYYQGKAIKGIELEFTCGTLTRIKADENEEILLQLLENGEDGRKVLAELGIGINPLIKKTIGYQVCDTKQLGSIHLALGENRQFGGKNQATIHWPLVMNGIDLYIDGTQIIKKDEILLI